MRRSMIAPYMIALSLIPALLSFNSLALAANEFKNQTTSKQNTKKIIGNSTLKKRQQSKIKRKKESSMEGSGDNENRVRGRDAVGDSFDRAYIRERKEESPKPSRHIITDEDDVRRR